MRLNLGVRPHMKDSPQPLKFWKLALGQITFVVACSAIWFYFRTVAFLAGPPSGDLYANNWGFQLVAYFLFWLPATLAVTGCVLAIERAMLSRSRKNGSPEGPP
jgi:hypothetical protein